MFLGGLALGAALMMLFQRGELRRAEEGSSQKARASVRVNDSMSVGAREGQRSRRSGQLTNGGKIGMEDLFEYLLKMSERKNSGDPNFLELVRYGAMIGELDAQGVQDLIVQLETMTQENPKLGEMAELTTAIAFIRWCEVDGPGALAELSVTENEILKDEADDMAEAGIRAWTAADPEGARAWIEGEIGTLDQMIQKGQEPGEIETVLDKGELHKIFLESYVVERGQEALEIFADVQDEQMKGKLRDNVIESLAEREDSVLELQKLLAQTQPGEFNSRREVMRKLAVKANEESRSWVEEQPPTAQRDQLVTLIAGEFLKNDPKEAAEWYLRQELVEKDRDQDRYSRIFGAWRQQDLGEANEWLRSQPDTPSRDTAESLAANSAMGQKNYLEAVEWVAGIQNEGLRKQAIDRVMKNTRKLEGGTVPFEVIEAAKEAGFEVGE
jgi:hypothetical protein